MTDASELGRALVALRPVATLICEQCGREFRKRPPARTCSNACRQKLHRDEKKRRD